MAFCVSRPRAPKPTPAPAARAIPFFPSSSTWTYHSHTETHIQAAQTAQYAATNNTVVRIFIRGAPADLYDSEPDTLGLACRTHVWHEPAYGTIMTFQGSNPHAILDRELDLQTRLKTHPLEERHRRRLGSIGAVTFTRPNARAKEAASGIRCSGTRRRGSWPNLVLEVGADESVGMLRQDVAWWLLESVGDVMPVRVGLLAMVVREPRSLRIEKWVFHPGEREPECATKIELDADGNGVPGLHTALLLGVAELMDVKNDPQEIALQPEDLRDLALSVYEVYAM